MVSQDPHTPVPPPDPATGQCPPPGGPEPAGGAWRWWFEAVGPWVGVAVALAAIVLRR